MNKRISLIAGLSILLVLANSCGTPGCGGSGFSSYNAGISDGGQGISGGQNVNINGAVNVNGNNGAGISATDGSVISNLNQGDTNINNGANSAITSSGKGGSSVFNTGYLRAGGAGGAARGAGRGYYGNNFRAANFAPNT